MSKITRVEIIDETGRIFSRQNQHVDISMQDDGQTMKVFIKHQNTTRDFKTVIYPQSIARIKISVPLSIELLILTPPVIKAELLEELHDFITYVNYDDEDEIEQCQKEGVLLHKYIKGLDVDMVQLHT